MIIIAGTAQIRPDRLAEAVAAGSTMAATSRAEGGCADYRFAVDIDDPHTIHLFEQWDGASALDAHFGTEHFAAFSATIADALAGAPSFIRYEVASSAPLFG